MTQRDRVLQLLRDAGDLGVHTFELRAQYIGNPSQRIAELEQRGHKITHTRERLNGTAVGTRYKLAEEARRWDSSSRGDGPGVVEASSEGSLAPSPTLFDPASAHTPHSSYEDVAA